MKILMNSGPDSTRQNEDVDVKEPYDPMYWDFTFGLYMYLSQN